MKKYSCLPVIAVLALFVGCRHPSDGDLPSAAEVNAALSKNATASTAFDALAAQVGADEARKTVLNSLVGDASVARAFLSGDGTSICIAYTSGLSGGVLTMTEGTKNTPTSVAATSASHPQFNNAATIADTLGDAWMQCDTLQGNALTLDKVKHFDGKGLIYLDTHGGVYGESANSSPIVILTGEIVPSGENMPESLLSDWYHGRVVPLGTGGKSYWGFLPSFIEGYCTSFPDSLVVMSACCSYAESQNTTMASAFLGKGAAVYVGWSESVSASFSNGRNGIDNTLFSRLVDGDSVQLAFSRWTLADRTDPSTKAVLEYVGAGDLRLPSHGEVHDAIGDSISQTVVPPPDLIQATVWILGASAHFSVRFEQPTFDAQTTVAAFLIDLDQNASTGHPGTTSEGIVDSGVLGVEYIVEMGSASHVNLARIRKYAGTPNSFVTVGTAPVTFFSNGMDVDVPLALLSDDDVRMSFKVNCCAQLSESGFTGVLDTMPDAGSLAGVVK